ncbi:MAG: GNAT family N-acetyltransferase [Candidatus Kerfeldbacteria bacterium]|nr:GNAT family N-acetyltransferase [Candidatus Kerfeldbacteria bacterium]
MSIMTAEIVIRAATPEDFDSLYALGLATPELKVSATEAFADPPEFRRALTNPDGVFLVAEQRGKPVGFVYATITDPEILTQPTACIIYIAVDRAARGKGVGTKLYVDIERRLRERGIAYIYALANTDSAAVQSLFEKMGMKKGHTTVWMDKRLDQKQ